MIQAMALSLAWILPGSGIARAFGLVLTLCAVSRLAAKRVQHVDASP